MLPDEESVLVLIQEDSAYENYFFEKLNDAKWFGRLKELGYFSPDKNPAPQPAKQEGYVVIPQWNILQYLERISQQTGEAGKEIFIEELLNIIESVSTFKDAGGNETDNYRTWWHFVKILLNIPNDKIPIEIIDLVPVWLKSRFGSSLVDADIATKLLPKFLPNNLTDEDIKKAEKLVIYLTDLKWTKGKDFLGRNEQKPETVVDHYWLLESFIKQGNAKRLGEVVSENLIYLLANRIKEIFRKRDFKDSFDIEEKQDIYRISFASTKDFEFECSVGLLKKEQIQGKDSSEEFLKSLQSEPKELFRFKVNNCKNSDTFEKEIALKIDKTKIPSQIKKEIYKKTEPLYESLLTDYSYIWFKHLDQRSESRIYEAKGVLTAIFLEIALSKMIANPAAAKNIIQKFTSEEYQFALFRRLVLFFVGENWKQYKEIFWEILKSPEGTPLLEDPSYEGEVELLLKKNIGDFSREEKSSLQKIIESGPQKYFIEGEKERYVGYWKQKWYNAVKTDPFFSALHEKIKKSTKLEDEDKLAEEGGWIGPGPSPLSKEDILKMSNEDLAGFMAGFKTDNPWKGSSVDGLADLLKMVAQEDPEKFVKALNPFLDTRYYYVYEILSGIKEAWKNHRTFNWTKLLSFIEKYVNRPNFWQDKLQKGGGFRNADHEWVAGAIGELITEGTKTDSNSFPENNLKIAQTIVCVLLNKLKPTGKIDHRSSDYTTLALNSAFGKVINGFINLSLKIARTKYKSGDKNKVKWSKELRNQFEKIMTKGIIEAYALLGEFMVNFMYLDKTWTENKIKKMETIENKNLWVAMMNGYFWSSGYYLNLHKLMKNHYLKAIKEYPMKDRVSERLLEHIGIGYLNDADKMGTNGLIDTLLEDGQADQIEALISYFWFLRKDLEKNGKENIEKNKKYKNKILEFWKFLYDKYKNKQVLTEDDKSILSDLPRLATFLENLTKENFRWLMLSAPYVNVDYNSPYLIEYLNLLKDKGNKEATGVMVAKLYLEMLKEFVPNYEAGNIISTIEYLYALKKDEVTLLTNEICNQYARNNSELLSEVYRKYSN